MKKAYKLTELPLKGSILILDVHSELAILTYIDKYQILQNTNTSIG